MTKRTNARPTIKELGRAVGLIDLLLAEASADRPRIPVDLEAVGTLQTLLRNELDRPRPGRITVAQRLRRIGKAFARPL